jgi:hypothetical protein
VQLAEAVAAVEDAEVVFTHFLEEGVVDAVHHAGGEEGFVILGREEGGRFGVEFFAAIGLEGHEGREAVIVDAGDEILFGVLKLAEVVEGNVNALSIRQVLADVAEDISKLEGIAEGDGVVVRSFGIGSEEGETNQADRRGDTIGVFLQVIPGVEALRLQVHLAAHDHISKIFRRDVVEISYFENITLEILQTKRGIACVIIKDRFPPGEAGFFFLDGKIEVIGEVIDDPAEGVEADEMLPPVGRDALEREGEVGLRLPRDFSSGGFGRHQVLFNQTPVPAGEGPERDEGRTDEVILLHRAPVTGVKTGR